MDRIVGVTDLQRNFRAIFDEVALKHTPYILTRGSRPEAAMIPYDLYLRPPGWMKAASWLASIGRPSGWLRPTPAIPTTKSPPT